MSNGGVNTSGLSFGAMRNKGKYYVDKTLLIKDILDTDDCGVYLFVRPRRFGKTTNVSMLDAFFNVKYKGNTGSKTSRSPNSPSTTAIGARFQWCTSTFGRPSLKAMAGS